MNETPVVVQNYLPFLILLLRIPAGFVDYRSHRRTDISHTSGAREALLGAAFLFAVLPFAEGIWRCLRQPDGSGQTGTSGYGCVCRAR